MPHDWAMRYLGFGRESGQGVQAEPTLFADPVSVEIHTVEDELLRTSVSSRFALGKFPGPRRVEGEVEVLMGPDAPTVALLEMLLGRLNVNELAGYRRYVVSPVEVGENPVTYTLELVADGHARAFVGVVCDSIRMEVRPDEPVSVRATLLGLEEREGMVRTPNFARQHPVSPHSATCLLGGVPVELEELTLSVENDLSKDHYVIGSRTLRAHELGRFSVTGSFSVRFRDRSHLERFLRSEETAMTVRFSAGTIDGVNERYVLLEMPRIAYSSWRCEVRPAERLVQEVEFTAFRSADGRPPIRFEVQTEE